MPNKPAILTTIPQPDSKTLLLHTLARFLPMAGLVVAIAAFYIQTEKQEDIHAHGFNQHAAVAAGKGAVSHTLEHVRFDLSDIAHDFEAKQLCSHPTPERMHAFEQEVFNFVLSHPDYEQIRWIGKNGMEKVRVNSNNGHPLLVPASQLQDKADRYYFSKGIKFPPGSIYVSPFDLNVEQGKVETPYTPMIRFVTPAADRYGNQCGLIVLNFLGAHLINDFVSEVSPINNQAMLLNQDGYYLRSPHKGEEWGFMFQREDLTLGHTAPAAWERIKADEQGQFIDQSGLWTFATVHPVNHTPSPNINAPLNQDYRWKIVTHLPSDTLFKVSNINRRNAWLASALLLVLLLIVSWLLSRGHLARKKLEAQLAAKASEYEDLYNFAPCGYHSIDQNGRLLRINNTELEWIGLSREEVIGKVECSDFLTPESKQALERSHAKLLKDGKFESVELEVICKDGSLKPVSASAAAVLDESGNFLMSRSVLTDITAQKRMEHMIHDKLLEFRTILDNASVAIALVKERRPVWVNQRMGELFGYTPEEIQGHSTRQFYRTQQEFEDFGKRSYPILQRGDTFKTEIEMRHHDGHSIWINISGKAVVPSDLTLGSIWVFEDISDRKELERKLVMQAHLDSLTGLNNRSHFYELAEHEMARARRFNTPVGLMMLDVDHFKKVNDTHGHDAGDAVLKKLAETCLHSLREIDIPARWGGEEFVVLLPGIKGHQLVEAAERLRTALASASLETPSGKTISFTVSIGVTSLLAADEDIDNVVKRADNALYAAKHAGRNCVREA